MGRINKKQQQSSFGRKISLIYYSVFILTFLLGFLGFSNLSKPVSPINDPMKITELLLQSQQLSIESTSAGALYAFLEEQTDVQ